MSHASREPGVLPVYVRLCHRASQSSLFLTDTVPVKASLWPPKYLVPESGGASVPWTNGEQGGGTHASRRRLPT